LRAAAAGYSSTKSESLVLAMTRKKIEPIRGGAEQEFHRPMVITWLHVAANGMLELTK
jgi:hypothetical protein